MEGWIFHKLAKAATFIMGQAPLSKDCNRAGIGTPFVKVGEFGDIRPVIREWTTDPKKLASESDVLLCVVGATCGKINLGCECAIGRSVAAIRPDKNKLNQFFLHYFLQGKVYEMRSASQGAAQTVISKVMIGNIEIPLPPLPEQERIVAILDEAFAVIATATANAEKNLANARELFDAFLLENLDPQANHWPRHTLGELIERGWIVHHMDGNHGGDYPRKHEFIDEGIPYISAKCIVGDSVEMSKAKYLSPDRAAQLRKGFAQDGDVLFAHNATVGPVAILNTSCQNVILGTSLTYYRCDAEFICPQYLAHYMRSSDFVRQYELVMRQSTRNQVPITKQRTFTHVIPPIEIQREIAATLDDVKSQIELLVSVYTVKSNALAELKQSILHKAFTGELTADPKAADRTLSEAGL